MEKIRIAFAGFRHDHIFALYQTVLENPERFEITGVWEEHPQTVAKMLEKGITVSYASYAELLADRNVQAVAIGNYYGCRGEMAIEALNAGKHIIADKPLCTSLGELQIIRNLAEEKNLSVGIMLDLRDNPNVVTATRLIAEGKIGKVNNIVFTGQHPLKYGVRPDWYFENGKHGGVINDIAIHGIDLVRLFTGGDVREINAARCWNFYAAARQDFFDSAQLMVQMSNGAGLLADVSYAAPNGCGFAMPSYWNFLVCGDLGTLRFGFNGDGVEWYGAEAEEKTVFPPQNPTETYLDRFCNSIAQQNDYTQSCLDSTEQTLVIQEFADCHRA